MPNGEDPLRTLLDLANFDRVSGLLDLAQEQIALAEKLIAEARTEIMRMREDYGPREH